MENNWEYSIEGNILTVRLDLAGKPLGLTKSERGNRVSIVSVPGLEAITKDIQHESKLKFTCFLSRPGTPDELRELYRARREAEEIKRGLSPTPA